MLVGEIPAKHESCKRSWQKKEIPIIYVVSITLFQHNAKKADLEHILTTSWRLHKFIYTNNSKAFLEFFTQVSNQSMPACTKTQCEVDLRKADNFYLKFM